MPRGDGTGPLGMGLMTGRGEGYCAGQVTPGAMNPMVGRGFGGRGFGGRGHGGHGQRHRFRAMGLPGWARAGWGPVAGTYPQFDGVAFVSTMPRDMQIQALERQAGYIRSALDEIQKRLEELRSAHAAETGDKK